MKRPTIIVLLLAISFGSYSQQMTATTVRVLGGDGETKTFVQ
jgi:hypothetical protein